MQSENRLGDVRPANRVTPAPASTRVVGRYRIGAALSSATRFILTGFALYAGSMYPELLWPLWTELKRRDSTEGFQPPPDADPKINRRAGCKAA